VVLMKMDACPFAILGQWYYDGGLRGRLS